MGRDSLGGSFRDFFRDSFGIPFEFFQKNCQKLYKTVNNIIHYEIIPYIMCSFFSFQAFAKPQLVRPNDDRVPLDKNTKDQSKIVNHIKELINNVVAQEQEEVKVGNLQKPLEFYDTVIKGRSMLLPSNSNHSDLLVLFNIYRSG